MTVAIEIIAIIKSPIDMKLLFLSLALLFSAKISAFAVVDLGSATAQTPYDRYMAPVKQVFSSLQPEATPMSKVEALMREGRGFRYAHTEPYVPAMPQETAARHVGDCKDKALWLVNQLGDSNARFVIGKMKRGSRMSHAWVMWQNQGQWWILDCTMNSRPIQADKVSPDEYVPQFSFTKGAAFRHSDKAAGLTADVAGKSAPVASLAANK